MYQKINLWVILVIMALLLAACNGPSKEYVTGETLLNETFSEANAWEEFVSDKADLRVNDGVYRIQTGDDGYIWGLNEVEHSDVVIEVTTNQVSEYDNNGYGVMCRADVSNNGYGYYFLISGDGFYSIGKGEGETEIVPLVEWTANSAIKKGQAMNKVQAVCIGNYLALWVNDKFLTEIEDTTYASGYAGLAATAFESEEDGVTVSGDTDITFDDLTIMAASLSN